MSAPSRGRRPSTAGAAASNPAAAPEVPTTPTLSRLGLRYALTYAGIAAVLFTIYAFPFELFGAQQDWLTGYLSMFASASGGLLGLVDPSVSVAGTYIQGRFPLQIVRNCDAAEVNILFASAVMAFPAPLARRFRSLAVGLVSLFSANILRICCLYFVGVYKPGWFKVAHEEIWPLLLIAVAGLLFLYLLRYMQDGGGAVAAKR